MKARHALKASVAVATLLAAAEGRAQTAPSPATAQPVDAATPGQTTPVTTMASANEDQLADIIVTAQKSASNVQNVPIAIQTVSGDALVKAGIQDTRDLQRYVPGLYSAPTGSGGSSFYIRGVGSINEAPTADSGLAVSLDQVYFSRAFGPDLALYDIERVEVLKGPQGTLYGRNSTAGAVNIISRKPQLGAASGDFSAEVGNYAAIKVGGGYNLPLGSTLALRAAFQINKHDGYLRDGYDDTNSKAARLHLLWEPSDRFSLLLTGEYLNQDRRGPGITPYDNHQFITADPYDGGGSAAARAYVLARNPGPFVGLPASVVYPAGGCLPGCLPANFAPTSPGPYQVDQNGFDKYHVKSLRAELNWNLGFATLTVVPALLDTNFADKYFKGPTPVANVSDVDQRSVEARIASPTGDRFTWIAGLFYFHEQQSYSTFNGSTGPTSLTYNVSPDVRTRSEAAFAQASFALLPSLKLTGGIRRTIDDKSSYDSIGGSATFPIPGPPPFQSIVPFVGDHSTATTYRGAIDWQVSERNLIYGYVATGFHAGGFNGGNPVTRRLCTPPAQGATPADFIGCDTPVSYEPEHLTAYALGSKNRFFDNRLQLNVEGYYWQYRGLQYAHLGVLNPSVSGLRIDNAGNAKIKGIDAELSWLATPNDLITVNSNYNESHYGNLLYYTVIFGRSVTTVNLAGRQFYNNPKFVTSFAYQHTFRLANAGSIVAAANGKYQTRMIYGYLPAGQTTNVYQDPYAKVDLNLAYNAPGDRFSVGVFVRNVTDKASVSGSGGNQPGTASPWVSVAPPRTFGANLRAHF